MKDLVIVDLDGTLCDDEHRKPLARAKDWDAYHAALHDDAICEPVASLLYAMKQTGHHVLAVTGRPERYRAATIKHLVDNGVAKLVDEILMRPDEDRRATAITKMSLIAKWGTRPNEAFERHQFVLDDNESVVVALRQAGFTVFQVSDGV